MDIWNEKILKKEELNNVRQDGGRVGNVYGPSDHTLNRANNELCSVFYVNVGARMVFSSACLFFLYLVTCCIAIQLNIHWMMVIISSLKVLRKR